MEGKTGMLKEGMLADICVLPVDLEKTDPAIYKGIRPRMTVCDGRVVFEENEMLVTTTNKIEGRRVVEYMGLVAGEAILGANMFAISLPPSAISWAAARVPTSRSCNDARQTAISDMTEMARRLGANAVIGVDIDYETIGSNGSMLMVSVSGTAVRIE